MLVCFTLPSQVAVPSRVQFRQYMSGKSPLWHARALRNPWSKIYTGLDRSLIIDISSSPSRHGSPQGSRIMHHQTWLPPSLDILWAGSTLCYLYKLLGLDFKLTSSEISFACKSSSLCLFVRLSVCKIVSIMATGVPHLIALPWSCCVQTCAIECKVRYNVMFMFSLGTRRFWGKLKEKRSRFQVLCHSDVKFVSKSNGLGTVRKIRRLKKSG